MAIEFNRTISAKDHMAVGSEEPYFRTSLSALRCIEAALLAANKNKDSIRRVLDFGCGYGRVLRVLKAAFPSATVTACDLMPAAVDFCAETFDAEPLLGRENLDDIQPCQAFDLIWVGSVFTHLPEAKWKELIEFLHSRMNPESVLVFTVLGRTALWVFQHHALKKTRLSPEQFEDIKRRFRQEGFVFSGYDVRHRGSLAKIGIEVSEEQYGLAFARPDWVCKFVAQYPLLFLNSFSEGGWGNNQDAVSLKAPKLVRDV